MTDAATCPVHGCQRTQRFKKDGTRKGWDCHLCRKERRRRKASRLYRKERRRRNAASPAHRITLMAKAAAHRLACLARIDDREAAHLMEGFLLDFVGWMQWPKPLEDIRRQYDDPERLGVTISYKVFRKCGRRYVRGRGGKRSRLATFAKAVLLDLMWLGMCREPMTGRSAKYTVNGHLLDAVLNIADLDKNVTSLEIPKRAFSFRRPDPVTGVTDNSFIYRGVAQE